MTVGLLGAEPVVLTGVPVRTDPAEVRAFERYKGVADGPADDRALADAIAELRPVLRPRVTWHAASVTAIAPHGLTLGDGRRLAIPDVGQHWGPIEAVVAAVATVGADVDAALADRTRAGPGDVARRLDSAASAAVECLAEWVNDRLCQLGVAEGLRVTNRISPGLAGWPLADQPTLVAALPLDAIGVRLAPDGTMVPSRTISLLVALGGAARVDHYFAQCRRCWAEACPARRMPPETTVQA
jgi:hypothetical protein